MSQANQAKPQPPKISYDEAVACFDSQADMARKLGVERASVAEWKAKGEMPEGRVWQLIALFPDKFGHLKPDIQTQAAA